MAASETEVLLDRLLNTWSPSSWVTNREYYLSILLPGVVRGGSNLPTLTDAEASIFRALKESLPEEEWRRLPDLVDARRLSNLAHIDRLAEEKAAEAERLRVEAKRREDEAVRARFLEVERSRLEAHRRLAEAERQREEQRQRAAAGELARQRLLEAFDADFLGADTIWETDAEIRAVVSEESFKELKAQYIRDWVGIGGDDSLALEQAQAISSVGRDTQVVARAGSGKTKTLVTCAAFLQHHCQAAPNALLLLAFNRDAAKEIRDRLAVQRKGRLPHVMTFHSLAFSLVHPDEDLLYDDPEAGQMGLSRHVQDVIDDHITSASSGPVIRKLMLDHFREDWDKIEQGGYDLAITEFIQLRRSLQRESLNGDYVKSFGERVIANVLFENDVPYKYERNFNWDGVNYRPDFTIPQPAGGIVVEYFGLVGDADYDAQSEAKRLFWAARPGWTLIEVFPTDLRQGADDFTRMLLSRLSGAGVQWRALDEEEIWQRARQRALDRFTGAMRQFVGRSRKRNLTSQDLQGQVDRHVAMAPGEDEFLGIGCSIYGAYVDRLAHLHKDDFDGLMWRAVNRVHAGGTRFARDRGRELGDLRNLRFVLVDEFQDFTEEFWQLLDGIRKASPQVRFFCVGDDWQAINGFAGAELRFFLDFPAYFPGSVRREITANYRSARSIVGAGNAVMVGKGAPSSPTRNEAGAVEIADLARFKPTDIERGRHKGDQITPALLRVLNRELQEGRHTILLSRRKEGIPWYVDYRSPSPVRGLAAFLDHLRSFLPEQDRARVEASTVHGFKGRERPTVIIIDAIARSYPLIHPSWFFLRIFGDSLLQITEEERRLFYVAVTRAQARLVILTEEGQLSPFVVDVRTAGPSIRTLEWSRLRPPPSVDGAQVEVRVRNAFDARDALKALRYRFESTDKTWRRTFPADGFNPRALVAQEWCRAAVEVEVYGETGELIFRHRNPRLIS